MRKESPCSRPPHNTSGTIGRAPFLATFQVWFFLSTLYCCVAVSGSIDASTRGGVLINEGDGDPTALYHESYALVIGASGYRNGWAPLEGVRQDVPMIQKILETHGFQVKVVMDPTIKQLRGELEAFVDEHGLTLDNRLVIYFSGHGHTQPANGQEMGYIVAVDAPLPDRDREGFLRHAVDMDAIKGLARRMQARHAFFVFDSCFSGSFFKARNRPQIPKHVTARVAERVRQFLTSGSANQPVPDESIFRRYFVRALEGEADLNKDHYVSGVEIGLWVSDQVIDSSQNSQTPQFGALRDGELDRGDTVFELPHLEPTSTPEQSPVPASLAPDHPMPTVRDEPSSSPSSTAWPVGIAAVVGAMAIAGVRLIRRSLAAHQGPTAPAPTGAAYRKTRTLPSRVPGLSPDDLRSALERMVSSAAHQCAIEVTVSRVHREGRRVRDIVLVPRNDPMEFKPGEELYFTIKSSHNVWLYVIDLGTSGRTNLLLPNEFNADSFLAAGHELSIPTPSDPYSFVLGNVPGTEQIEVYGLSRPLADSEGHSPGVRSTGASGVRRVRDVIVRGTASGGTDSEELVAAVARVSFQILETR